jgi:hypothetical protein
MTVHDLDKLPKWARQHIENLDRKIKERDDRLAIDRGDVTRVRVNDHSCISEPEFYLPEDSKVTFLLGEPGDPHYEYRNGIDVQIIESDEGDRAVQVRGAEAIDVLPQVSNSVIVKMRERAPGVWRDGETGEHFVAESMDALAKWTIVAVAPHKPGVLKVHAVRPPTRFSTHGPDLECYIVYVKAGAAE